MTTGTFKNENVNHNYKSPKHENKLSKQTDAGKELEGIQKLKCEIRGYWELYGIHGKCASIFYFILFYFISFCAEKNIFNNSSKKIS